jgi:hypothetical protein
MEAKQVDKGSLKTLCSADWSQECSDHHERNQGDERLGCQPKCHVYALNSYEPIDDL